MTVRTDQLAAAPSRWETPWIDAAIWAAALGATALTLWYSLGAVPPAHGSDKDLHALAYFVDALAVLLAVVWRPGRRAGRFDGWGPAVVAGMLGIGGLIELAQGGFVHRDAQFTDWIADAVGIGAAWVAFGSLRWIVRERAARHRSGAR
jgi:VanZ family protein